MTSQTCHRVDLAHEQLEMALDAFLQRHRFAPAITLASAAERVLGGALRSNGQEASVDWKFDAADLAHTRLCGRPLDRKTFNAAEADLKEAACWMLVRACENAYRLGLTVQGFDAFNEWFCEHVVGV